MHVGGSADLIVYGLLKSPATGRILSRELITKRWGHGEATHMGQTPYGTPQNPPHLQPFFWAA